MATSPGPPSAWYLRCQGVPVAWQKSSCMRRSQYLPLECSARSKRSTMSTLFAPNSPISQLATGMPNAATMRAHSHSFSTEVRMSAWRLPTSPSGSLKMCVVGVEPMGRHQRAVVLEKRGLFLRAGDGDAEIFERRRRDCRER